MEKDMRRNLTACFFLFVLLLLPAGRLGAQDMSSIPSWAIELLSDMALYPDQYVMGIGNAATPTPIVVSPEKRFQANVIFCPLVGFIPAVGAVGFDMKFNLIPEEEVMPELTLGGGYWNWYLLSAVKAASKGQIDMTMWGYNLSAMITKTTAEKIRYHIGVQYSKTDGGVAVNMSGGGTIPMPFPTSISMKTEKFDLLTGVSYALTDKNNAYFLIGYDCMRSEVFERIGFVFGGFVVQVGMYPSSKFAIIPSLEWAIIF